MRHATTQGAEMSSESQVKPIAQQFGDNGGPHGQTVTVEITDELCIELKEYLEFKINVAEGQRSMYADDCGKLWSNWEELEYGCRCQIGAYREVLSKIERMGK